MPHFYKVLLFILLCRGTGSTGTEIVSGSKEEDVALSCLDPNVTDTSSSYRVRWLRKDSETSNEEVIFEWPKKSPGAKRVKLEEDGKGQMCLFLKTLQKSDEGWYKYEIWEGWDTLLVKEIYLKVKDCSVLEAVKAVLGTPVELNCFVDTTSGLQGLLNISWASWKGNSHLPVDSERAESNGTCLTIQSVTASDKGWYRCTYLLGQTQRCADINLLVEVNAPEDVVFTAGPFTSTTTHQALTVRETVGKEMKNGTLIAAVISVTVSSIIFVALTALLIHFRRRKQRGTQQLQWFPEEPMSPYENVTCPFREDSEDQVNSLYQFQEESLCTFQN